MGNLCSSDTTVSVVDEQSSDWSEEYTRFTRMQTAYDTAVTLLKRKKDLSEAEERKLREAKCAVSVKFLEFKLASCKMKVKSLKKDLQSIDNQIDLKTKEASAASKKDRKKLKLDIMNGYVMREKVNGEIETNKEQIAFLQRSIGSWPTQCRRVGDEKNSEEKVMKKVAVDDDDKTTKEDDDKKKKKKKKDDDDKKKSK